LQRLIRQEWEHQRYFPLPIATKLSQQFATHGLQFFKVNKTVTHVSVARPQYLDIESNPVSDGIRRIVEYINDNAKCTRKKLVEALAPTPRQPKPIVLPVAEAPAPAEVAPAIEGTAELAAAPAKAAEPQAPDPTPEQTAVMVDLHWLIHQGAVLEFADGRMETAKKPLPKPAKPEKPAKRPEEKVTTNAGGATAPPAEPATGEAGVPASAAGEAGEATAANPPVAEMTTDSATESAPVTTLETAASTAETPASEPAPSAPSA